MAKLKEGVSKSPFGFTAATYTGEITDELANFLLDTDRATPEEFEELPGKGKKPVTPKSKGEAGDAGEVYDSIPKIKARLDELQFAYPKNGVNREGFDKLLAQAEAEAAAKAIENQTTEQ